MIGGPTFQCEQSVTLTNKGIAFGTAITIEGTSDFQAKALADLIRLSTIPNGRRLLAALEQAGKAIVVNNSDNHTDSVDNKAGQIRPDGSLGIGTGATVFYDPKKTFIYNGSRSWHHRPPAVGLGHELIHALHGARGTTALNEHEISLTHPNRFRRSEAQVIGLPFRDDSGHVTEYGDQDITEYRSQQMGYHYAGPSRS